MGWYIIRLSISFVEGSLFPLLFLVVLQAQSQLHFDVNISESHLKKVEQGKDARTKLKSYKEVLCQRQRKSGKKSLEGLSKRAQGQLEAGREVESAQGA
ncbi:MAG: hypothetical protein AAF600_11940 [Bacteroidota bacterium]